MSGMMIHLDDFGEDDLLERRFEIGSAEVDEMLADTEYRCADGLVAQLVANRVGSTVRVKGSVRAQVQYECGRCLEARTSPLDVEPDFVLMEAEEFASTYAAEEIELEAEDMDVSVYSGEQLDLAPLVREAILLELPAVPRCPEELREQCDEAYRRNVGEKALKSIEEASMDQRWAPLTEIKLKKD